MRWVGHVAQMGRGEMYTGFCWGTRVIVTSWMTQGQMGLLLTHSMEQSPSSEAKWFSNIEEIYGNRKFITTFTRAPPPVRILSQLDPTYASSTFHFLRIQVNIILPTVPVSSSHPARDLPTCTAVPQHIAPPRSPFSSQYHLILLPALLCTLPTSHCQIQDSIRLYLTLRLQVIALGSPSGNVRLVT